MTDFLLMRLYGPLASWGEIAVGETRHSSVHPSRSALLGLLGSALGIRRDDDKGQHALNHGYRFGIRLECVGTPLRDYHTIQTGVPARKSYFRTRRQELAADTLGTILSTREYRCDSMAIVAVEKLDGAPADLISLASALRSPYFPLYLGRKSCPLAVPLMPQILSVENLRDALDGVEFPSMLSLADNRHTNQVWPSQHDRRAFRPDTVRYYWEDGMLAGMDADFDSWRHDQPLSRKRWQFTPRREWVALKEAKEP